MALELSGETANVNRSQGEIFLSWTLILTEQQRHAYWCNFDPWVQMGLPLSLTLPFLFACSAAPLITAVGIGERCEFCRFIFCIKRGAPAEIKFVAT